MSLNSIVKIKHTTNNKMQSICFLIDSNQTLFIVLSFSNIFQCKKNIQIFHFVFCNSTHSNKMTITNPIDNVIHHLCNKYSGTIDQSILDEELIQLRKYLNNHGITNIQFIKTNFKNKLAFHNMTKDCQFWIINKKLSKKNHSQHHHTNLMQFNEA